MKKCIRSLEMNRKLGLKKEKLELIIKRHFPKEDGDSKSCMIVMFEELSDMVQYYEYNCPHDIGANLVIYDKMQKKALLCTRTSTIKTSGWCS